MVCDAINQCELLRTSIFHTATAIVSSPYCTELITSSTSYHPTAAQSEVREQATETRFRAE